MGVAGSGPLHVGHHINRLQCYLQKETAMDHRVFMYTRNPVTRVEHLLFTHTALSNLTTSGHWPQLSNSIRQQGGNYMRLSEMEGPESRLAGTTWNVSKIIVKTLGGFGEEICV